MNRRTRAPWLAAAALSLSLGPVAASAQDPTENRTGHDPFDVPGSNPLLEDLGGETQRQLEEQRRQREEEESARQDTELLPDDSDSSDVDLSPSPDDPLAQQ